MSLNYFMDFIFSNSSFICLQVICKMCCVASFRKSIYTAVFNRFTIQVSMILLAIISLTFIMYSIS